MLLVQIVSWLTIVFLLLQLTKNPDKVFWISFILFFDPGGFFAGYLNSDIIWRIKYFDVFFALMALAYFTINKARYCLINYNRDASKLLRYLLFVVVYFVLIYGLLIPLEEGYPNFPFFLQKNRLFIYGLPFFMFTYYFSFRSIEYFYRYLIIFAIVILSAYLITLITGFEIIKVQTWSRYGENARISMISYGLINMVQPLGLIVLASGHIRIPYKQALYVAMVMMIFTIVLTLTRREFMRLFFMMMVIPMLIGYITKTSSISKFGRYLIPLGIGIFFFSQLFPDYLGYSDSLVRDLYYTLTTGADKQGVEEYRITGTGGLETAKAIIRDKWMFGMGYYPVDWAGIIEMKKIGDPLGHALDASSEVPVYGAFMRLGVIGLLIPLFMYIFIIRNLVKAIQTSKSDFYQLLKTHPVDFVLLLTVIYFLLAYFTIDIYNVFGAYYNPNRFIYLLLFVGLLLGLMKRLKCIQSKFENSITPT